MSKKPSSLLLAMAVAALSFAACSPSAYVLSLESRSPSQSGLNLDDKSMSIIYLESEDGSDTLFNNRIADALAFALETDYFGGEEGVKVYNLKKDPAGVYNSRDTLSQYIMMLDSDVVMILDTPVIGTSVSPSGAVPASSKLYVYDSMKEDEEVVTLNSHASIKSLSDSDRALNIGKSFSSPLKVQWQNENFTVLYFDGFKWINAIELADQMKWSEAIDIWMDLVKNNNAAMSSSARYNVALGCFILGQNELALEWLDSSDKTYPLSVSQGLRTKIKAKMEK